MSIREAGAAKSARLALPLSSAVPYSASLTLGTIGITHALVDAATAGLVLSQGGLSPKHFFNIVLLYNVLAFGTQFLLGTVVDRLKAARSGAAAGCLLAALGVLAAGADPWTGVVIAAVGNALFHVSAGSTSLNIAPGKAAAPGIFVAPGAAGLFAGVTLAKTGAWHSPTFVLLLILSGAAILLQEAPRIRHEKRSTSVPTDLLEIMLILFLVTVLVRGLVGMTVVLPWNSDPSLTAVLVGTIVVGKALGGVIADRLGWRRVAVTGLLLSAPLITFLGDIHFLGIAGAFLFQMTMAVTLTATACLLPGRPAFAFGLPCLALIVGALPGFTNYKAAVGNDWILFAVIFASAGMLHGGLGLFSRLGLDRME